MTMGDNVENKGTLGVTNSRFAPQIHPRAVRPFVVLCPASQPQGIAQAAHILRVRERGLANFLDGKRPVAGDSGHLILDDRVLAPVYLAMLRLQTQGSNTITER